MKNTPKARDLKGKWAKNKIGSLTPYPSYAHFVVDADLPTGAEPTPLFARLYQQPTDESVINSTVIRQLKPR